MEFLKSNRMLLWVVTNGLMLWLVLGMVGAPAFIPWVLGLAWMSIILSIPLMFNSIIAKMMAKNEIMRSVPGYVSVPFDLVIAFLFVSSGFYITAFGWLMSGMIQERAFNLVAAVEIELNKED